MHNGSLEAYFCDARRMSLYSMIFDCIKCNNLTLKYRVNTFTETGGNLRGVDWLEH